MMLYHISPAMDGIDILNADTLNILPLSTIKLNSHKRTSDCMRDFQVMHDCSHEKKKCTGHYMMSLRIWNWVMGQISRGQNLPVQNLAWTNYSADEISQGQIIANKILRTQNIASTKSRLGKWKSCE